MSSHQRLFEGETSDQRKRMLRSERQATYRKRQKTGQNSTSIRRHVLGRMDQICVNCGANFWIEEKDQRSSQTSPSFAVCCAGGKVSLLPLLEPPSYLMYLYT